MHNGSKRGPDGTRTYFIHLIQSSFKKKNKPPHNLKKKRRSEPNPRGEEKKLMGCDVILPRPFAHRRGCGTSPRGAPADRAPRAGGDRPGSPLRPGEGTGHPPRRPPCPRRQPLGASPSAKAVVPPAETPAALSGAPAGPSPSPLT